MKTRMSRLFLTFLLTAASLPVYAASNDANWYEVELILFANRYPLPQETEKWPEEPGSTSYPSTIELAPLPSNIKIIRLQASNPMAPYSDNNVTGHAVESFPEAENTPTQPFQVIDKSYYQLSDAFNNLTTSSRYEVLLHVVWRQPAFDTSDNAAVYLHEGITKPVEILEPAESETAPMATLPDTAPTEDSTINPNNPNGTRTTTPADIVGDQSPETGTVAGSIGDKPADSDRVSEVVTIDPDLYAQYFPDAKMGPPSERFFGTLKLTLSRYLHIVLDMTYRKPVPRPKEVQNVAGMQMNPDAETTSGETTNPEVGDTLLQSFRLVQSRRTTLITRNSAL